MIAYSKDLDKYFVKVKSLYIRQHTWVTDANSQHVEYGWNWNEEQQQKTYNRVPEKWNVEGEMLHKPGMV